MQMKARSVMSTSETVYQLGYERIVAWIQSIIDALFTEAADDNADCAERLELAAERAAHLFTQALNEDSNLEMDWLWYAAHMVGDAERRYCLNRALAINPHSGLARTALSKLPKPPQAAGEIALQSRAVGASKQA
jgi:hypothetical protein